MLDKLTTAISRNPSGFLYLVRTTMALLMAFGLHVTAEQMAVIILFGEAVLAFFGYSVVTPNAKLDPDTVAKAKAGLVPVLLIGLALSSSACASSLAGLEGLTYRTISVTKATGDGVCDAGLRPADKCKAFNAQLLPAIAAGDAFSQGVAEGHGIEEIPALVSALLRLRDATLDLVPPEFIEGVKSRFAPVLAALSKKAGG